LQTLKKGEIAATRLDQPLRAVNFAGSLTGAGFADPDVMAFLCSAGANLVAGHRVLFSVGR
jgi:hypothetical protein